MSHFIPFQIWKFGPFPHIPLSPSIHSSSRSVYANPSGPIFNWQRRRGKPLNKIQPLPNLGISNFRQSPPLPFLPFRFPSFHPVWPIRVPGPANRGRKLLGPKTLWGFVAPVPLPQKCSVWNGWKPLKRRRSSLAIWEEEGMGGRKAP
jgi:hypothetical protein